MIKFIAPNSDDRSSQPKPKRARFGLTISQVLLLPLILGAGLVLLLATVKVALINTLVLFTLITLVGLWQCRTTSFRLADSMLGILGTLWLIKIGLTLFLLYVGWMPQLDPESSVNWGYDPQRYYQDAFDLIEDGWNPAVGSNYQGIIFYYGAIFYVFGHNPVIPALINAVVTLLGTLFLIRVAYEFKEQRDSHDWTIAYLLLIPEFVWYDVMTSRETLTAVLVLVATLSSGRYLVGPVKMSLPHTVLLGAACLVALLAVRTSMAIPVVVSVVLIGFFLRSSRRLSLTPKLLFIVLAIGLMSLGSMVQQITGGVEINHLATLQQVQSFEDNVAAGNEWSENSIGLLLAPNNALQSILFLLPRTILYLVAPLPTITVTIADLLAGSWGAWQSLFTIFSSILNIIAMPYALAGLVLAYSQRKQKPAPLAIHISFWITLLAIAGGNIIIHERYRLMMSLLLFTSAWLGFNTCTRKQINRIAVTWYGLLACAAIFFMIYKTMS